VNSQGVNFPLTGQRVLQLDLGLGAREECVALLKDGDGLSVKQKWMGCLLVDE
jgi:hypothetical protein